MRVVAIIACCSFALTACGQSPDTKTGSSAVVASDGATSSAPDMARTTARVAKKLAGQCSDDASCDAIITDDDIRRAQADMTTVLGSSATGPKSSRAPSGYFAGLEDWHCQTTKDQCARTWFQTFRADALKALSAGDDTDDIPMVPNDASGISPLTPYSHGDLVAAGVAWDAVDAVDRCRIAIMYRRWRASGDRDTTKADLRNALDDCRRGAIKSTE